MALDDDGLKTALEALYDGTLVAAADAATARDNFINGLVTAMHNYVASADIVYNSGLEAPGGPVDGVFNGNLA
jgi:hypothetical protein